MAKKLTTSAARAQFADIIGWAECVVYEVHEDIVLIMVLRIGHRKDVYR